MSMLEDQIRAATRDRAREITRASIPPLRLSPPASRRPRGPAAWLLDWLADVLPAGLAGALPGGQGGRGPGALPAARRRWQRGLIPLAAAVAVLAIVAGVTAVTRPAARTAHPHAAPPSQLRPAPSWVARAIPRYYLAIEGTRQPYPEYRDDAALYSSVSGALLATVTPPRPYRTFINVSAAADDRTFVLAAQASTEQDPSRPTVFFVLHFTAGGRAPALTEVRGATLPAGTPPSTFAVSPDGQDLAIAYQAGDTTPADIRIVSLASGSVTTWSSADGSTAGDTADPRR